MIVYADVMFVLNLIVNYLLLLSVCGITKQRPPFYRLLISSALGATSSFIILLPPMNIAINFAIKIAVCAAMTFVAFPAKNLRNFLSNSGWLISVTFAYCGIMTAIVNGFAPKIVCVNNMAVYADLSPILLIISSTVCYIAVKLICAVAQKIRPQNTYYNIELINGSRLCKCRAMLDTGCNLHDLYSGNPVIVIDSYSAQKLLPSLAVTNLHNNYSFGDFDDPALSADEAISSKIRYIPYSAIGGKGLMQAFCPDKLVVMKNNSKTEIENVTAAISKEPLANGVNALIGDDIVSQL